MRRIKRERAGKLFGGESCAGRIGRGICHGSQLAQLELLQPIQLHLLDVERSSVDGTASSLPCIRIQRIGLHLRSAQMDEQVGYKGNVASDSILALGWGAGALVPDARRAES